MAPLCRFYKKHGCERYAQRSGLPENISQLVTSSEDFRLQYCLACNDYRRMSQLTSTLYDQLDVESSEIRILILLPGYTMDLIRSKQVTSLDKSPSYEALSYVWGETRDQKQIYADN